MLRLHLFFFSSLLFVLQAFVLASPVPPSSVYVSPFGNDHTGTGTSSNPFQTLTRALSGVASNGTIWMETGVYSGSQNLIVLNIPVTLRSIDLMAPAVISCSGGYQDQLNLQKDFKAIGITFAICSRAIFNQGVEATFINCTFAGLGSGGCSAGGVYSTGQSAIITFENVAFYNNTYAVGINGGSAIFTGCNFEGNGVVVAVFPGASAAFRNCFISQSHGIQDTCDWGPLQSPIINHGVVTIINSTLRNNNSPANGGVVFSYAGSVSVADSELSENQATLSGGAIYLSNGSVFTAKQVVFMNNTAVHSGGAIGCDGSQDTVYLSGCQEVDNSPPDTCVEH